MSWVKQDGRLALGEKTDFGRMQDKAKIPGVSSERQPRLRGTTRRIRGCRLWRRVLPAPPW